MPFSDAEKTEIVECVVKALSLSNTCACHLSDIDRAEMGHLVGMVRDIGRGCVAEGVEEMRRHHYMLGTIRRRSEKVGIAVTIFVFVTAAGWVMGPLKCWVEEMIRKFK